MACEVVREPDRQWLCGCSFCKSVNSDEIFVCQMRLVRAGSDEAFVMRVTCLDRRSDMRALISSTAASSVVCRKSLAGASTLTSSTARMPVSLISKSARMTLNGLVR